MRATAVGGAVVWLGQLLLGLHLAAAETPAANRPFLHPLFTDHMVFPRDQQAPVWGWTSAGTQVTVTMAGKTAEAVAEADGRWLARLGPFAAGGPHTLEVKGPETVTVQDVLTGDVWICSGQSNMQWGMWGVLNSAEEIAKADFPHIRLFTVPNVPSLEPTRVITSRWTGCNPQTVAGFSAVGFFFGRHLHRELDVPMGLINSSWGGTIAEAWVSADALKTMPDFETALADEAKALAALRAGNLDFAAEMKAWWAKNDAGSAANPPWSDPGLDAAGWARMDLPGNWEGKGLPDFDGVAWFRREFTAPETWAGKEVTLSLGPIDDRDTTWVNGVEVGAMNDWNQARNYKVPAGVVKPGRNAIASRVLDTGGGGGFHGKPDDMKVQPTGADAEAVALAGAWSYQASTPLTKTTPAPQRLDQNPNVVTVLYNGMISPLVPFGIKGAIWYQGESNAGRAEQYARLLPTLIRDWRARFGVGDFPFFIVQLANFMAVDTEPRNDAWPQLREAQYLTTKAVPNAGLATIIDIGDAGDIHPKNKQDVGHRLALAALAMTYGKAIECSGPVYRELKIEDGKARLGFEHLGGGLVVKGDRLQGFAIAGADGRFVWAEAKVEGDTVLAWSAQVPAPTAVRYAWSNNPVCNLYNQAGLPAVPFRTDR